MCELERLCNDADQLAAVAAIEQDMLNNCQSGVEQQQLFITWAEHDALPY